jgi:hypothetical protein
MLEIEQPEMSSDETKAFTRNHFGQFVNRKNLMSPT